MGTLRSLAKPCPASSEKALELSLVFIVIWGNGTAPQFDCSKKATTSRRLPGGFLKNCLGFIPIFLGERGPGQLNRRPQLVYHLINL
jgi:hypothetical protein